MIGKSIMKNSFLGFSPGAERIHHSHACPARGTRHPHGQPEGSPEAMWVKRSASPQPSPECWAPPGPSARSGGTASHSWPGSGAQLCSGSFEEAPSHILPRHKYTQLPVQSGAPGPGGAGVACPHTRGTVALWGPSPPSSPCPPSLWLTALRQLPAGPGPGGTAGCCGPAP